MRLYQGSQRFTIAGDFVEYMIDASDRPWQEGADMPRMLSIGLYLRMSGWPGRIAGLERVLRHMADRGGAWLARRDAVAHHWIGRFGQPQSSRDNYLIRFSALRAP